MWHIDDIYQKSKSSSETQLGPNELLKQMLATETSALSAEQSEVQYLLATEISAISAEKSEVRYLNSQLKMANTEINDVKNLIGTECKSYQRALLKSETEYEIALANNDALLEEIKDSKRYLKTAKSFMRQELTDYQTEWEDALKEVTGRHIEECTLNKNLEKTLAKKRQTLYSNQIKFEDQLQFTLKSVKDNENLQQERMKEKLEAKIELLQKVLLNHQADKEIALQVSEEMRSICTTTESQLVASNKLHEEAKCYGIEEEREHRAAIEREEHHVKRFDLLNNEHDNLKETLLAAHQEVHSLSSRVNEIESVQINETNEIECLRENHVSETQKNVQHRKITSEEKQKSEILVEKLYQDIQKRDEAITDLERKVVRLQSMKEKECEKKLKIAETLNSLLITMREKSSSIQKEFREC